MKNYFTDEELESAYRTARFYRERLAAQRKKDRIMAVVYILAGIVVVAASTLAVLLTMGN